MNAKFVVPFPKNEPVYSYAPGSPEKLSLKKAIADLKSQVLDIPAIIGGKEVRTGNLGECRIPHEHAHLLAKYHKVGEKEVKQAIAAALEARKVWSEMPWNERLSIFLRAAELITTKYRALINAATMLCQSKTAYQAEIDAACELADFLRYNPYYAMQIFERQPLSAPGTWNMNEHRPLEGFIFAVTPFNFTSIAGNLPSCPAMLGNVALWKPASSAVYSGYWLMKIFQEAGLPDGVINFLPGDGSTVGTPVMASPDLAGIHFTGSTAVFQNMWKTIGTNIANYKTYPRIVGETGGKDFVFAHKSADVEALNAALVRGSFEFQGQKCSAASRAYIPEGIWTKLKPMLIETTKSLKMGNPEDFTNFMCAVIDRNAFNTIKGYIDYAKQSKDAEIIVGGGCDDSVGYFIEPTVIVTTNPHFKTIEEEIFGPVLTLYIYPDEQYEEALELCNTTSPYGLTGAIWANDRYALSVGRKLLRNASGNFYINDKPTGAVVGQQPFGGARASGTNDKAGDVVNLLRWISPRTIKETLVPSTAIGYPHMAEK